MNLNRKLLLNRYLRKAEACTSLRSLLPASFPMNMITTKKNIHTMIAARKAVFLCHLSPQVCNKYIVNIGIGNDKKRYSAKAIIVSAVAMLGFLYTNKSTREAIRHNVSVKTPSQIYHISYFFYFNRA